MKVIFWVTILIGLLPLSASGSDTNDYIQSRALAATCTGCHGTDGRGQGGIPNISGWDTEVFVDRMLYFKSDNAQATLMHQIAPGYTLEQINLMAQYFSKK